MYYAIIVLNGSMDPDYFTHLIGLVLAVEILYSRSIESSCLDTVQLILQEFVKKSAELYDDLFLKSGTHELLHLCESTRDFGPPNNFSCFQFEEINRKFIRGIKGKNLVGDELIKNFSISKSLSKFSSLKSNYQNSLLIFTSKYSGIKSTNNKEKSTNKIKITDKIKACSDLEVQHAIENYLEKRVYILNTINHVKIGNTLYTTTINNTRFNNSCVLSKGTNLIGLIRSIVLYENFFSIANALLIYIRRIFIQIIKTLKVKCFLHQKHKNILLLKYTMFQNFFHEQKDNLIFISTLNASHLFL